MGLHHRSPAEHLPRAELVDEDLAAVGSPDLDLRLALEEEVELIGCRALSGQLLPAVELLDLGDPRDRLQIRQARARRRS